MSTNLTEDTITKAVQQPFDSSADDRFRQRQEVVLLSDILGLSMLLDKINQQSGVDEHGQPVVGAHVDTWHSDGDGFYDGQQADKLHDQPAMRALLTTDEDGRFRYRSIQPRYYPVPADGPCGEIMRAANRSAMRPPARPSTSRS